MTSKQKTKKSKFIITNDKYTKEKLLENGYKLISVNEDMYVFEQNPSLSFSLQDNLKFAYTNTLVF